MFCPKCGKEVSNELAFCSGCGNPSSRNNDNQQINLNSSQNEYYAPPRPQQPTYVPPQPSPMRPANNSGGYQSTPISQGNLSNDAPLSVGNYIGMMILSAIPIVGFILILVWGFGSNVNQNKKNWARAMLILMIIGIVLYILFAAALVSVFYSMTDF